MNVMPLPLADESEINSQPVHTYAGKDDRITGVPLVAIWTAGIVGSWALVIALGVGLALGIPHLAEFLAGL